MTDDQQGAAAQAADLPSWVPVDDDPDEAGDHPAIRPQAQGPAVIPSPAPPAPPAQPTPAGPYGPGSMPPAAPYPPGPHQFPPAQSPGLESFTSLSRPSIRQRLRNGPFVTRSRRHLPNVNEQLLARVNQPIRGDYRIAVLSLKGGVGKTTTTVGLGATFATLRGDRVIAVDANPDLGTLAQRVPLQTNSTVRDLIADTEVQRYSDVRAHTSQAPSRLEVLASERDPAAAESFSEAEYRQVMSILRRYYNIILTDCGTGLSHSAMRGVLDLAHSIILVTSPALDGARSADATLDWLQAHGYGHLVSSAVLVISSSRSGSSRIAADQLAMHFLTKCRAVHEIPFDEHLAEGAIVDLDQVGRPARQALTELAATVADDMGRVN